MTRGRNKENRKKREEKRNKQINKEQKRGTTSFELTKKKKRNTQKLSPPKPDLIGLETGGLGFDPLLPEGTWENPLLHQTDSAPAPSRRAPAPSRRFGSRGKLKRGHPFARKNRFMIMPRSGLLGLETTRSSRCLAENGRSFCPGARFVGFFWSVV